MTDRPRTLERPWLKLILDADPQFYADRRKELEYEFTRRNFYSDPVTRGVYNEAWEFSNDFSIDFHNLDVAMLIANGFN